MSKPLHWFALQINSWFLYDRDLHHEKANAVFSRNQTDYLDFRALDCKSA